MTFRTTTSASAMYTRIHVKDGRWDQFTASEEFKGETFASCAQFDANTQIKYTSNGRIRLSYGRFKDSHNLAVRTDTFLVYAAPGEPLGKQIRFEGQIFEVAEKHRDLINYALVLSYSIIQAEKKWKETHINGDVIKTMEIPTSNGWFKDIDAETGIPIGKELSSAAEYHHARYWHRMGGNGSNGRFIGAVIHNGGSFRRHIYANYCPEFKSGVVLLGNGAASQGKGLMHLRRTAETEIAEPFALEPVGVPERALGMRVSLSHLNRLRGT